MSIISARVSLGLEKKQCFTCKWSGRQDMCGPKHDKLSAWSWTDCLRPRDAEGGYGYYKWTARDLSDE